MNKKQLELLHAAKMLVGQILESGDDFKTDEARDLRHILNLMKWHTANSQAKEVLKNTVVEITVEKEIPMEAHRAGRMEDCPACNGFRDEA